MIRIFQLIFHAKEIEIRNGFEMWLSKSVIRQNIYGNTQIVSSYTPEHKKVVTTINGYNIEEMKEGFKKITFEISANNQEREEDEIMLMIEDCNERYKIRTENCNIEKSRIGGSHRNKGIFILKPNEKINLLGCDGNIDEEFVAIKYEGKMYLIKVHKD